MNNNILAYAVLITLAAGITTGLWCGLSHQHGTNQQAQVVTIPDEYQADYRAAKELHQEWMAYPSWTRQAEIQDWCYESFSVPLPVVRRVDPPLEMWVAGMRQEYMFTRDIWEVDELTEPKKHLDNQ